MAFKQETKNLPGWDLPIDEVPEGLFATTLSGLAQKEGSAYYLPLKTTRGLTMLRWINHVTDKADWCSKVFDDTVVSRWRAKILARPSMKFSEEIFKWCIDELRLKAGIYQETGAVSIYNAGVVKSDITISERTRNALIDAVRPLEMIPELYQDWYSGSDGIFLYLVDPTLFPLIHKRSRILEGGLIGLDDCVKRSGEGITITGAPKNDEVSSGFSLRFQSLPCNVQVVGGVKITSYINNLHPQKHKDLYAVIEDIIDKTIPLWEMTLTPLKESCSQNHMPYQEEEAHMPYQEEEAHMPYQEEEAHMLYEEEEAFDNDEENYNNPNSDQFTRQGRVVPAEPGAFVPVMQHLQQGNGYSIDTGEILEDLKVDLRKDYGANGLQIIIALANIQLSPEKPRYQGSIWFMPGRLNEHICATAIYYYDNHNITESGLALCQADSMNGGHTVQKLGTVEAKQGRLTTFPAILHQRIQTFRLADLTRPGHRKYLILHLVDPNIEIISTANVPCQQRHWWGERVGDEGGMSTKVPQEIHQMIIDRVTDFPISTEEAKELRLQYNQEQLFP